MSRSSEAAQGEAIQRLSRTLESWGVEDALAKAHDVIRELIYDGWRPRGPRCELTQPDDGRPAVHPEAVPDYLEAKAALRGGGDR